MRASQFALYALCTVDQDIGADGVVLTFGKEVH